MLFAKIKALSTRAVRGTYKERDTFCGHNMYTCAAYWIHWQFQVVRSIMERYALSNIQVKALPWLVLYGKYGTQRVALRQNIALGFASCYICISYNTGKSPLPDIYARARGRAAPEGECVYIRQSTSACVILRNMLHFRHSKNLPKLDSNISASLYSNGYSM